jgi:hypothetical protein
MGRRGDKAAKKAVINCAYVYGLPATADHKLLSITVTYTTRQRTKDNTPTPIREPERDCKDAGLIVVLCPPFLTEGTTLAKHYGLNASISLEATLCK